MGAVAVAMALIAAARKAAGSCWCASGACTQTPRGTVCGVAALPTSADGLTSGVDVFLGIRYGTIPKRFAASVEAVGPWPEPYMATAPAPVCDFRPTKPTNKSWAGLVSEDCLFVDILRPAGYKRSAELLPVMAWVHGGGMMGGSSTSFDYSRFVQTQRLIVVSINYRLGPLGFFSSEELAAENTSIKGMGRARGNGGMNGQYDQITALKWLRNNIAGFGGDPEKVTLFGQSAGGLSVCSLIVSPLAKGLFKRAIVQSGSCNGAWGPGSTEFGLAASKALMHHLNVSSLAELRDVPAQNLSWPLAWPNRTAGDGSGFSPFPGMGGGPLAAGLEFPGYFVDGAVLPEHPSKLYAQVRSGKASLNVEQLMIGGTSRDGVASGGGAVCSSKRNANDPAQCSNHSFTSKWPGSDYKGGAGRQVGQSEWGSNWRGYCVPLMEHDYHDQMKAHWTPAVLHTLPPPPPQSSALASTLGDRAAKQYPVADYAGSAPAAWLAADGDYNVVCPAIQIASDVASMAQSSSGGAVPVFVYYFSHGPVCNGQPLHLRQVEGNCSANVSAGWATHTGEVSYVTGQFGYPYTSWGRIQGQPRNISNQSCWFAWGSKKTEGCELTRSELELAGAAQSYWGSFARTGRPQAAGWGGEWEEFTVDSRAVLQLDVGALGGLRPSFKHQDCAFWSKEAPLGPY